MRLIKTFPLHLIFLALAGVMVVYLVTSGYGPGVSTDAVEYISAAENLAQGDGFMNYKGEPYLYWAPLYPVLLAIPRLLLDMDPFLSGWILNGLAFGAIIFISGLFFSSYRPNQPVWHWMGAGIALFSTTLIGVSANIGSDPIFIIQVLLFLLFLNRYAERKDTLSFIILIMLAGLATVQRFVGVTLIVTGALLLLFIHKEDVKRGIFLTLIFGGVSIGPLLAWIIRNITVTGTLFGARNPSAWIFSENLRDASLKISHWFLPYSLSSNQVFLAILGLSLIFLVLRPPRRRLSEYLLHFRKPSNLALILFTIIYFIAILLLTKTEDHTELYDDRYYAPILIPLFMLVFQFLDAFFVSRLKARFGTFTPWIFLALFSVWLVYPVFTSYKFWKKSRQELSVPYYNLYNLPRFRDSAVTRELPDILRSSTTHIFSNYSAAVYFFTRHLAESSPSDRGEGDTERDLAFYSGIWPAVTPAILVWYEPNTKMFLYPPKKLEAIIPLDPLFTSRAGGIYQLGAGE